MEDWLHTVLGRTLYPVCAGTMNDLSSIILIRHQDRMFTSYSCFYTMTGDLFGTWRLALSTR